MIKKVKFDKDHVLDTEKNIIYCKGHCCNLHEMKLHEAVKFIIDSFTSVYGKPTFRKRKGT